MMRLCSEDGICKIRNVISFGSSSSKAEDRPGSQVLRFWGKCLDNHSYVTMFGISAPVTNLAKAQIKSGKPLLVDASQAHTAVVRAAGSENCSRDPLRFAVLPLQPRFGMILVPGPLVVGADLSKTDTPWSDEPLKQSAVHLSGGHGRQTVFTDVTDEAAGAASSSHATAPAPPSHAAPAPPSSSVAPPPPAGSFAAPPLAPPPPPSSFVTPPPPAGSFAAPPLAQLLAEEGGSNTEEDEPPPPPPQPQPEPPPPPPPPLPPPELSVRDFAATIPALGTHLTPEHEAVVMRHRVAQYPASPETWRLYRQAKAWVAAADTAARMRVQGATADAVGTAEAAESEAESVALALFAQFDAMQV